MYILFIINLFFIPTDLFSDEKCLDDYILVSNIALECESNIEEQIQRFNEGCTGSRIESFMEQRLIRSDQNVYQHKLMLFNYAKSEREWFTRFLAKTQKHESVIIDVIEKTDQLATECDFKEKTISELLLQANELVNLYEELKQNNSYINHCKKVIKDIEMQFREGIS